MTELVHLPPTTYFRLRYLQSVAEAAEAQGRLLALQAAQAAAVKGQAYQDALANAGRAHDFDAALDWTWDDAQTALVPTDGRKD